MLVVPPLHEWGYTAILLAWVLFTALILTRWTYNVMRGRGLEHNVAVYYNRKLIHVLAGATVALATPFVFTSYLPIAVMVIILAVGNYIPHRTGKLMHWYQVAENMYEVNFIIMWGIIMGIGFLLGNILLSIVAIMFMAVGDGVTGLVRNLLYRRRTKAFAGNLAMMAFCIPAGFMAFGFAGAVGGLLASLVEKFEFGPIDDNITVPTVGLASILLLQPILP